MEVAEQIIVMNDGKIEQSGGPRDLYEHPGLGVRDELRRPGPQARRRLGAAARRRGPPRAERQTIEALIDRIVHLGFEVRVELTLSGRRALLGPAHARPGRRARAGEGADRLRAAAGRAVFSEDGSASSPASRGAERAGEPPAGSRRRGRRLTRTPGFCRLAQLPHRGGQLVDDQVGERRPVHASPAGSPRTAIQTVCSGFAPPLYSRLSGPSPLTRRERPLDRADDVTQASPRPPASRASSRRGRRAGWRRSRCA